MSDMAAAPWRADAAIDVNRQPLLRELVSHSEALELLAIGAMVEHKVIGPDLVRPGWRMRARSDGRNAPPRPLTGHLQVHATADMPDRGSSAARRGEEKRGSDGSRTAGIAPTGPSSAPPQARPWLASGPGSSTLIAPHRTACRPVAPR